MKVANRIIFSLGFILLAGSCAAPYYAPPSQVISDAELDARYRRAMIQRGSTPEELDVLDRKVAMFPKVGYWPTDQALDDHFREIQRTYNLKKINAEMEKGTSPEWERLVQESFDESVAKLLKDGRHAGNTTAEELYQEQLMVFLDAKRKSVKDGSMGEFNFGELTVFQLAARDAGILEQYQKELDRVYQILMESD